MPGCSTDVAPTALVPVEGHTVAPSDAVSAGRSGSLGQCRRRRSSAARSRCSTTADTPRASTRRLDCVELYDRELAVRAQGGTTPSPPTAIHPTPRSSPPGAQAHPRHRELPRGRGLTNDETTRSGYARPDILRGQTARALLDARRTRSRCKVHAPIVVPQARAHPPSVLHALKGLLFTHARRAASSSWSTCPSGAVLGIHLAWSGASVDDERGLSAPVRSNKADRVAPLRISFADGVSRYLRTRPTRRGGLDPD